MLRIIYRLLCFCILFGSFLSAKAIDERYTARELTGNSLAPDSISTVLDEVYFNPSLKPLQTTWYVKNLITFQINEQYRHLLPDDFNATLKFRIRYTQDVNGTPVVSELDTTLSVEYAKLTPYQQKNVYIASNWYKVEIIIKSILDDEGNVSPYRDALKLTNEILINREYNFSCTSNAVKGISGSDSSVSKTGEYHVSWSPEKAADEYDLEWTYIDSSEIGAYQNNARKIFRNNSTRVSISTEKYSIPLLYDSSGYLYYRVRAVQVKRNGQRIESAWSSDYSGGLGSYYFKGLDPHLNWQASTSFAEEGKRKSVVQYFDGSLKSRQTVTKDNTTDTTIIAETLYDFQGRPVIQVMPAPSLSSIIKYTPGFNRLNDPSINEYPKLRYDSLLVDTCNCKLAAPAMATSSGAANYYSPANPLATRDQHKYIPDAKGYVFAETKYLPDNTGRVSAQGGVGETFKIGSGHETTYTYNKADQEELDALFGTEVGNASHYFKNTVKDANGQVSISYVDMHGRTIATALAGTPPVDVDTLTSNQPNYILKNLIDSNSNVIKGMVIENSNGLYVSKAGWHKLEYSLLPDSISIKACDTSRVCYDCVYDLRITITEECNDSTKNNQAPFVFTESNQIDTTCGTVNTFPAVKDSVYLRQGSYIVTKTLTINKAAMDYYREVFLAKNTCTSIEQTIQQQKNKLLSKIECTPSCDSCKAALGNLTTFRQNYWQQLGVSGADTINYMAQAQTAYNKQLTECNKLCDNTGLHQSIREQMLADVTPPFGQYANPDNIDQFSIFRPVIWGLSAYQLAGIYKDENGNDETWNQYLMSREKFVAEFKSSWAETLLKLHPEYVKLRKYDEFAESNIWDEHFANTQTYQAAVDSGFLNPGNFLSRPSGNIFNYNLSHRDPFFTDYYLNGKTTWDNIKRMSDSLDEKANDENHASISAWSLATIMAHCPGGDLACLTRYKSKDSAFAIGSDCSGDLDIAWQYFREMYLQEKREIIDEMLHAEWLPLSEYPALLTLANTHSLNFSDPYITLPETIATDSTAARDSLQVFINNNCAAYVNQWVSELESCYDSAARAWIIPRLIDVCREGGDENHLFGASTVKPSSTYQYKSFEEVIKAYHDSNGNPAPYNSTCNVYLISAPVPYDQQPVYYDKPVYQKPDSCECATIGTLYQKFLNAGKDSTFSDYIYRTTGTRMYQGVLDTLRMACNGQINCSFLKDPLVLPPVLQCGGEKVCVGCNKVDSLYKRYITQFPDAKPVAESEDTVQVKKNLLFERFMNTNLGFTKQATEYLTFIKACHSVTHNDSLEYIFDQFVETYKNGSMYTPGGQYKGDTTDWYIEESGFDVSWQESIYNGMLTFPARIQSNPGFIHYYYNKPLHIPASGLSIEARLKLPLLDSTNCAYPNFQFQLRPQGGWVNALFFNKSIPCNKLNGAFDLADSTHPGHIITSQTEMAIDMNQWVKIKLTIKNNKYRIFVADTFLMEVPYTGTLTQMNSFGFFFGTGVLNTRSIPAIDYIRVYNGCDELVMNQDFSSVNDIVVPDITVRVAPDDFKSLYTSYFNTQKGTSYTYSQIDSIYADKGLTLDACGNALTCDTLKQILSEYTTKRLNDSSHFNLPYIVEDITAFTRSDVYKDGYAHVPDQFYNTANGYGAHYRKYDTLCPGNVFTVVTRVKKPALEITSAEMGLQVHVNENGTDILKNFVSAFMMFGQNPTADDTTVMLANSGKIGYQTWFPPTNPRLTNYYDWTEIKITHSDDSIWRVYYNDTFVNQLYVPKRITKIVGWQIIFAGSANNGYVDYVKIYDQNNQLQYVEEFEDARQSPSNDPEAFWCTESCQAKFTGFYNQRTGSSLTYTQIQQLYSNCGVQLNGCSYENKLDTLMLCGKTEPVFPTVAPTQHSTCDDIPLFSNSTGTLIYDAYRDSLIGSFNDRYLAKCLSARYHEKFTLYQPVSEFHYTLYYYDQAGNLVKTIPPAGVDVSKFAYARAWSDSVSAARSKKQFLTPQHKLPTQYRYNTLNQVVKQKSPDGGQSEFWYDRLGRLAISQNARQKPSDLYSYTRYDSLGRITEVGQVNSSGQSAMTNAISRNQSTLESWLAALSNRRGQITNTIYDLPYPGFVGLGDPRMVITQRNLRNRVSYTTLTDTGATNVYSQGTFYTYDILGNVDELLQDYGYGGSPGIPNLMNQRGNRWKKIRYQYDLISGKVNMVIYQPGYRDAFFHRYSYDAENRLTLVETSPDSLVWEKDARYEYYRHGPLARVTLGEQQVQGLDYAYTLQGWLKGINSSGGVETFDMGEDGKAGSLNQYTARDAIGLTLNYFTNDYSALNGHPFPGSSGQLNGNDRPLYNGNISSSSVYQKKFEGETGGPLIFYNYKYDQLNRLTRQDAFEGVYNASSGYWDTLKTMGERLKERIAYDANGNILKYLRNSIKPNQVKMDSLSYIYYPNTNQLRRIKDTVSDNLFYDPENQIVDINSQPDSNYVYDSIGNLIEDKQEKITSIKWNVYGKIEEINRIATDTVPASNIKYTYDAMGNRISQVVTSNGTKYYTWYVRDAQGNILSTYSAQGNSSLDSLKLQLADRFMYGSSRLGTITINDNNVNGGPGNTEYYYENRKFAYDRGHKSYELTNHLGNVLATVSDRKFGVSSGGSSLISYYNPHIVTAQDYYPFGMLSRVALPSGNKNYAFGFNGQMMNNDAKGGLGNSYTAQYWEYDSRIGRRWNLDPKPMVGISDYSVFRNRPLAYVDTNGDTTIHATPDGKFIDADNTGGGVWIATGNYAASRINVNIGTTKKPKYEERVINVFNTINLYKVNDPAVDIQQLSVMQPCDQVLTFVSDENINWIMDRSNVKKKWLPNRFGFAYNQSVDGKMDFNYSYTLPSLGIVTTTPNAADYDRVGGFMIMGDPNKAVIAYNLNDAGQWLWGHAMMRLGFGIGTAMQAANRNSIQSGYGPDTEADQNAIGQGFLYKTGTTQLNQGTIFNPTFNHRRDNREDNNLIRKSDRNSIRF